MCMMFIRVLPLLFDIHSNLDMQCLNTRLTIDAVKCMYIPIKYGLPHIAYFSRESNFMIIRKTQFHRSIFHEVHLSTFLDTHALCVYAPIVYCKIRFYNKLLNAPIIG